MALVPLRSTPAASTGSSTKAITPSNPTKSRAAGMTTERGSRPRRSHAAAGGRLLIGGLSASVLIGLIGAMARAERPPSTAQAPPVVVAGPTVPATQPTSPSAPAVTEPPPTTQAPATGGATQVTPATTTPPASPPTTPVAPPVVPVTRPTSPPTTISHAT